MGKTLDCLGQEVVWRVTPGLVDGGEEENVRRLRKGGCRGGKWEG